MWSGCLRSGFRASLAVIAFAAAGACTSTPQGYSRWLTPAMLEEFRIQQEYGDFLVARYSGMVGDLASASTYYARAFSNSPADADLLELASFASMAAGDIGGAIEVARSADRDVAADAPSAQLALVIDDIASARAANALSRLTSPGIGVYNADIRDALSAWLTAQTDPNEALRIVDWISPLGSMRGDREVVRALVLMAARRDEEALAAFEGARNFTVSAPDIVYALGARLAASRGEPARAQALLDAVSGPAPASAAARASLAAGQAISRPALSMREGAALIVHVVSSGGRTRMHPETSLMRQAAALHLDSGLDAARLAEADALEAQDRAEEAVEALRRVAPGSPWRADALMQAAETLARMDRAEMADEMVMEASASPRRDIIGRAADFYRSNGEEAAAITLYARIAAMDEADGVRDWRVLYAAAMAHNAAGDWPAAEAGLLAALEIEPNQPELLNALGYNWVDRGMKLEEGMALIARAIAIRPDLGHIVDSYGWAFYRLGKYEEAIPHLERAAALMPTEAEVIDHLGDAYWQAGRRKEARYTWSAALRADPEGVRVASLRDKLAKGLPETGLAERGIPDGGLPAPASRSLAARP